MSFLHLGPSSGSKERRVGLTARTPFGGNLLIMHKLQKKQSPTLDDVSHKPVSSSDDALSEASCGASDYSAPSNPRGSAEAFTATFQRGGHALRSLPKHELGVDPSNIPSTPFLPNKRNFQSMNGGLVDDDEIPESFLPKKVKTKTLYGQSQRAYNRNGSQGGLSKEKTKETKQTSSVTGRKPQKQDKCAQPLPSHKAVKNKDLESVASTAAPDIETPRAKRASQRSSRPDRIAPQAKMTNGFKVPMRVPSPEIAKSQGKSAHVFKVPPVVPTEATTSRGTRSRKLFRKPELFHANHVRGRGDTTDMVDSTRRKIDRPDHQSAIPSSSMTASSRRSTSNDRASPYSSTISSPPSSPELDASIQEISSLTFKSLPFCHPPSTTQCPYCKERIDGDLLLEFDNTVRLSVREQSRFCKAHRVRSAEVEWKEKGYPIIDWPSLDTRLNRLHAHLDDILENRRESFYRNAYEGRVKSRQNETAQQSLMSGAGLEHLDLGYYGSRGAKSMMQNIITHFTDKLHRLSTKDKLISSSSVSHYVQAVLAPEMAVSLVKEDMGVDDEAARALLRDSAVLGNLLNEEEDEEIRDEEIRDDKIHG